MHIETRANLVAVLLALTACGGSDAGGSTGDVRLDAARIFEGNLIVSGTITLPAGSGAGKNIQLTVTGGSTDLHHNGSFVGPAGTTPGEQVRYTIAGLVAGDYTVRARVDQDGDTNLASHGDLDGYFGGTVEAPVLDGAGAKKVTVGASGATHVDFGLGRVP
jgi:hypothetical protein